MCTGDRSLRRPLPESRSVQGRPTQGHPVRILGSVSIEKRVNAGIQLRSGDFIIAVLIQIWPLMKVKQTSCELNLNPGAINSKPRVAGGHVMRKGARREAERGYNGWDKFHAMNS